jgi:hypothetical protein
MGDTTSPKIRCPEEMNSRNITLNNSPSSESKLGGMKHSILHGKMQQNGEEFAQLSEKHPASHICQGKTPSLFTNSDGIPSSKNTF